MSGSRSHLAASRGAHRARRRHGRAPGFVLVAALATVMIGAIWSASASQRMIASAGSGRAVAENARAREAAADGLAAAIYLAVTAPRSACGWQPQAAYVDSDFTGGPPDRTSPCLRLDGRAVRLAGAHVEIQDWGGLVSVRLPRTALVDAVMLARAPAPATFTFAGSLQDFGDLNDERRVLGAEAAEYAEHSRAPPPNHWPRTPYEAFDALGWEMLTHADVADDLGIGLGGGLNINTAPMRLLAFAPGLDADLAAAAIKARAAFAIEGSGALSAISGGRTDADPFAFMYLADAHVRARAGPEDGALVAEASIRASSGDTWPLWTLDYQMPTPRKAQDDKAKRTEPDVPAERPDHNIQWLHTRP